MSRFYVMSESLSPTLAWGFLGTDQQLTAKCLHFKVYNGHCETWLKIIVFLLFKAVTMKFVLPIFSVGSVDYSSVQTLAHDILTLAKHTADEMHTTPLDNGSSL